MMRVIKKIAAWPYKHIVVGSLLSASAVVSALAFFSFNPHDQSWLYHSSQLFGTTNVLGSFGANLSAFFFYSFGVACWFVVALLLYGAYLSFFKVSIRSSWDRLFAASLLPVVAAALFTLYRFDLFSAVTPGGVAGSFMHATTLGWFESLGASLFLHVLMFIVLIVLFPAAFLYLLNGIVKAARFVASKEKFLRPAYSVVKKVAYGITVPFVYSYHFVRRLFNGEDVEKSGQSIVSFEQQLLDEVEGEDVGRDQFWSDYLGKPKPPESDDVVGVATSMQTKTAEKKEEPLPQQQSILQTGGAVQQPPPQKKYRLPHRDLFKEAASDGDDSKTMNKLQKRATILEEKLEKFGVFGSVVSIKRGPVVTLFEYQPKIDSKISKIIALEDDLALALQALSIRIIAPIPGKSVVGFEVANVEREDVILSSLLRSQSFGNFAGRIPLILGQDTIGNEVMVDLAKMPHLLIAGSTGSGKSVALNAFLVSMLCKLTPDELKLILVDPKRLEFASYADIPHLLFPIVTDPKRTAPVLRWVVNQMEERYEKMATVGARNIFDYNQYIKTKKIIDPTHEPLPFIVIVIDELSDLMMTSGRDIEDLIARIAQMARAAGIHMIVATQRPSVDVITGLIKVNFPSRISFRVTSKVDSRTILDACGAEKLLGSGDMLFLDSRSSRLHRLHGAYVSNQEIEDLANHIRAERPVRYLDLSQEFTAEKSELSEADDELYEDVIEFLCSIDEVSISLLQRKFRIGYNRSARIIDLLESRGVIMPAEGSKMRKVIR